MIVDPTVCAHLLGDLFQTITLIKMAVATVMVVLLALLAEVVSPRFAGIISGYPLGSAISLFFMGYEISPEFAAESAVYTMVGLVATQTFAYCYYVASSFGSGLRKIVGVPAASLVGICGYFLTASTLRSLQPGNVLAVLLPVAAIIAFSALFRTIENVRIEKRVALGVSTVVLRSMVAGGLIILITSVARVVGPHWAGLFAAFPVTMLPLLVIIHHTYDVEHVHAILKNVPRGLGSIIVYSLAVSFAYPTCGIYAGTLLAYVFATLYLVAVHLRIPLPWKAWSLQRGVYGRHR